MTIAKPKHLEARRLLLTHLDMHPGRVVHNDLDPAEAGIVGDTAHAQGGDSYHLGADQTRARNGRDRYSVDESPRDRQGLNNYASGMDVGYFKVTTGRGVFDLFAFSRWLVALCKAGDPDTVDIREVIYSPDGRAVRRWDALGRRSGGDDSHLFHTHISEYRDADGSRMVRLVRRWLVHIGLLAAPAARPVVEEFVMASKEEVKQALLEALETARPFQSGGPKKRLQTDRAEGFKWPDPSVRTMLEYAFESAVSGLATARSIELLRDQIIAVVQADDNDVALTDAQIAVLAERVGTGVAQVVNDDAARRMQS